ncbi:hypothetical protein [Porticoccus sp.]
MGDGVPFAKEGGWQGLARVFLTRLANFGHWQHLPVEAAVDGFSRPLDIARGISGGCG